MAPAIVPVARPSLKKMAAVTTLRVHHVEATFAGSACSYFQKMSFMGTCGAITEESAFNPVGDDGMF